MKQAMHLSSVSKPGLATIIGISEIFGNYYSPYGERPGMSTPPEKIKMSAVLSERLGKELAESPLRWVIVSAPLLKNTYRTIVPSRQADTAETGYSGHIRSGRWTSIKHSGAGGVDVTGAPGSDPQVEGTSGDRTGSAWGMDTEIYFKHPAPGRRSVRWAKHGSSLSTSTIVRFHPVSNIPFNLDKPDHPLGNTGLASGCT
jgi:hypothetical protein